jgi:alkanesulfonate monooxygenase SsuD/methylene tetrahydromethanopterin reductase-like flavin-dependent oxidoreductase (luciferase family)
VGGSHPHVLRRAASIAGGWMGSGGLSTASFAVSVPILKGALEKAGRDPATFPISKRVCLSLHERLDVARAEEHRWFSVVYDNPDGTDGSGVHGTPEQMCERRASLLSLGANHLLLNPVYRHTEQLEALADVVGLSEDARSCLGLVYQSR